MISDVHKKVEYIILSAYSKGGVVSLTEEVDKHPQLLALLLEYMQPAKAYNEYALNRKGWEFAIGGCWTGEERRFIEKRERDTIEIERRKYLSELQRINLELSNKNLRLSNTLSVIAVVVSIVSVIVSALAALMA